MQYLLVREGLLVITVDHFFNLYSTYLRIRKCLVITTYIILEHVKSAYQSVLSKRDMKVLSYVAVAYQE